MTAEEFLALPERPRGERWSLVEGEPVMEQPLPRHQRATFELAFALESWVRASRGRGSVSLPIDVQLDGRNVYAPDVLWYAEGRDPTRANVRPSPLPDIAIEVRSPSTWRYDIGVKKQCYEGHGLQELWLVDTAAVLVFRRSTPGAPRFDVALELTATDELESPLLPGFALPLERLFSD
jgi:Uma2 family endonuclease